MMQGQEKVMTKIQKWLKDMKVEYNFSLYQFTTMVMNFKDLNGKEYRIEPVSCGFRVYGCHWEKVKSSQSEVIKALTLIDYKFGADMDRLNKEREDSARFERIQKALDDVKRESFYFGGNGDGVDADYELTIETNGLGMKIAYSRKLKNRDFMPDIVIRDLDDYKIDRSKSIPKVLIQRVGSDALNALDAMAWVTEIEKAIEAVVYFEQVIKYEWATIEKIEIV